MENKQNPFTVQSPVFSPQHEQYAYSNHYRYNDMYNPMYVNTNIPGSYMNLLSSPPSSWSSSSTITRRLISLDITNITNITRVREGTTWPNEMLKTLFHCPSMNRNIAREQSAELNR